MSSEEHVDIAMRIGSLDDSSLVARKIGAQQIVTIAARAYLAGRAIGSIEGLASHRCLVFRQLSSGRGRAWRFQRDGQLVEWPFQPYLAIDDGEAMVAAVHAGLGIAQVPSYMADEWLQCGELVEILSMFRTPPEPISAVYLAQRNLPASTRAFVDFRAALTPLRDVPPSYEQAVSAGRRASRAG